MQEMVALEAIGRVLILQFLRALVLAVVVAAVGQLIAVAALVAAAVWVSWVKARMVQQRLQVAL